MLLVTAKITSVVIIVRAIRAEHPVQISIHDLLCLLRTQRRLELGAEAVAPALLLQSDEGGIPVIIADAEFLPHVDAVDLLPQGLVGGVVKIQGADAVLSPHRVGIGLRHSLQALPDAQQIGVADLVLPLMPVLLLHVSSPFNSVLLFWMHLTAAP